MGKHKTAHRGMGSHHSTFCESDTNLFHIQQIREDEVHAGVRQRGIANGRTDALKGFYMELLHREVLIGSIAPIAGSHFLMHFLCRGFCKTVGNSLRHHLAIWVAS